MADAFVTDATDIATSIPEVWAKRTLADSLRMGFWSKFVGSEGSGAPIIRKLELLNKPGDLIHIVTTGPLTGSGVTGDGGDAASRVEGNEEALTTGEIQVAPFLRRHGVRWLKRANKKSILSLREEARMRLREWGAEVMDDHRFAQFASTDEADVPDATYTPNEYFIGTDGTPLISEVATGDVFTVTELQKIHLALYLQNARPIRTSDGEEFYALVMHPNAAYNLKQDSDYQLWVKDARERGQSNPLFTGALAVIDGMILYQHPNVVTANDGAASIPVARNMAFGGEAFVEGVDEVVSWDEDTFDYGNEFGIAYRFSMQSRRALEKNSLVVYSAAEAVV